MATPLPEGMHILVERKTLHPGYAMPSMEMATDHYSIGYIISGDRKTITPSGTYSSHAGDVALMSPFIYHRTIAESDEPYEKIMVKYAQEYVTSFIDATGHKIFEELHEGKVFHFTKESREKIESLFLDMVEEFEKDTPYKEFVLGGMLFRLLLKIWEDRIPYEGDVISKTPLTPAIVDAITYIENYYSQNPSLEDAARAADFSPAYFSRIFSAQMGKSYSEYLGNVKLRHVCILLAQTDKSIMEIAQETGYCHGNYLSDQFKKKMGMTPGQFRKNATLKKN